MPKARWIVAATLAASLLPAVRANAQSSSLLGEPRLRPALTLAENSWYYIEQEPPKQLQLNDVVTVVVQQSTRTLSDSDVDRKKKARFDAVLSDWLRLDGFNLKPAEQNDGDPRAKGTLDSQYKVDMSLESRNSITLRIAARIVAVRPNGNLVLEGHQTIQDNEEVWEAELTGEIGPDRVLPDGTVLSQDIADLKIVKCESGHVRDAARRGWMTRLFDTLKPF
jgi:flagellar L-ring protein precursor FlgH